MGEEGALGVRRRWRRIRPQARRPCPPRADRRHGGQRGAVEVSALDGDDHDGELGGGAVCSRELAVPPHLAQIARYYVLKGGAYCCCQNVVDIGRKTVLQCGRSSNSWLEVSISEQCSDSCQKCRHYCRFLEESY